MKISAEQIQHLAAVTNNFLMKLTIPGDLVGEAAAIMNECHRISDEITSVMSDEAVVEEIND